jgi:DNA-binding NtrC family response regulator
MVLVQQNGSLFINARPRPDLVRPLEEVKREAIESALILCEGNMRQAARQLGVSYTFMRTAVAKFRREDA